MYNFLQTSRLSIQFISNESSYLTSVKLYQFSKVVRLLHGQRWNYCEVFLYTVQLFHYRSLRDICLFHIIYPFCDKSHSIEKQNCQCSQHILMWLKGFEYMITNIGWWLSLQSDVPGGCMNYSDAFQFCTDIRHIYLT